MSIMTIDTIISIRFIHMKSLVLLGLTVVLLGCGVRWRTMMGIRLCTLVALITLLLLVPISLPLIIFYWDSWD